MKKRTLFKLCISLFGVLLLLLFKPLSNAHFLFTNGGDLVIDLARDTVLLYESDQVEVSEIKFRRSKIGDIQKLLYRISNPELYLIKFKKNKYNFSLSYNKEGESARSLVDGTTVFAINSSFYNEQGNSLGELIIDGQRFGEKSSSSGFFKVINGKAIVGPKSVFSLRLGHIDYSCQAHPSVMKNGKIWDYISRETLNQNQWSRKTYRNLCGMDKDGNICFLVSGNGGLVSVKEITEIGKSVGIRTASLFDAGSALQYRFSNDEFSLNFSASNNLLDLGKTVDRLFKELTGKKFYNISPVFIVYDDK
ncbi:phosphodiester glycosidase family protein [Sediminitomix flava]|uniref:Uncharacterized protein DUF2233 n=1 Tax=Sediminitomix flava TaxID=379075 RepID=A0A315ZB74_SEDFL|nr:phosphodiester glycosidase family protein [Sediminitomix flava]PWJ42836.1 uncharacterized protein DUF2233 [Sediminitomix flava]